MDRLERVLVCAIRTSLQVRLVDLDDVRARRLEIPQLLVDGFRIREREASLVGVVVVLRLLRHRERAGTVILIRRVVSERRSSTSRTSTGRMRRTGPITGGTGFS